MVKKNGKFVEKKVWLFVMCLGSNNNHDGFDQRENSCWNC